MWCLHFREITIVSLCTSVRVCWSTCGHLCGDQRSTAGAILQVPSPLSSETGFLGGQELQLASEARNPVHHSLPPQCWDSICIFLLFLALFTWVLKIKFRAPWLQVKYFSSRDISQPLCYFLNWILYYLKSTIYDNDIPGMMLWTDLNLFTSIHLWERLVRVAFPKPLKILWLLRRMQESRAAEAQVTTQRKQYLMRWAVRNGSPQL